MKAWWAGLAARERFILMGGGVILALIVVSAVPAISTWLPEYLLK